MFPCLVVRVSVFLVRVSVSLGTAKLAPTMDAQERPGRLFSRKIVGSWGTERVSMPPTARGRIPLTAL